ncbi:MAG: ABC transporter permease [Agriterribacter sp.]
MFKNYFKTAWRSIKRYKVYSIINISGLALGIASCMIIFLVVKYELGYDGFNKKADRIYRVTLNAIDFNPSVSMAIAPAMRNYFPELEQVSQVWHQSDALITINNKRYTEKDYMYADEHFLKIFDYEWVKGDPANALTAPNEIILTQSMAKKYFGASDAMGQIINLDNRVNLKVTGIIKDVPGNTHLPFEFLVSFATIKEDVKGMMDQFYAIAGGFTYILTPPNYNIQNIQKRIPEFITANWGKDLAKEARLPLQPLKDIHFDQRYLNSFAPTTSKATYWALIAIAVFIIVIACINFINLATAQAIRRAKEIGVRKVLGSNRSGLIAQFLGETAMMVIIALILAFLMAVLFLPKAALWLDIKINASQFLQPSMILFLLLTTIGMILLAGLYPAFVQSAFNPVASLKSKTGSSNRGLALRKILVIVQFVISQVMIIGTLVIAFQMDFFKNQDLGFDKDAVISLPIPDREKREVLGQELGVNPGVKEMCFASGAPAYNNSFTNFMSPELGVEKGDVTEMKFVDEHYMDMFKLNILAGDKIVKVDDKDTTHNAVINETLMQKLNIFEPRRIIGKHVFINGWYTTVTGVMQDFQSESKHKKRRPCALFYRSRSFYTACIKLQPFNMRQTIADIDKKWSALFPDNLFQYEFLDEHIAKWYRQEEKEYVAFKMFSGIAIFIGCLGLYGLIAFAATQRIKEIGVRKVLGASLSDIVFLFSKEFIWLILIAFCIAAPLAYYAMHNWLQSFAYQITINAGIFITALGASFFIAGCTIAYQAVKAGVVNPVKSLRTE